MLLETRVLIPHSRQYTYYFFPWFCDWLRTFAPPLSLLASTHEVFQLARSIAKYQSDSDYFKDSQIDPYTQQVVDHILSSNSPVQPVPLTPPRRKTKTAQTSSSRFYNNSWKVSTVSFEQAVSHFEALVSDYNLSTADIDSVIQQAISKLNEKQDANYSKLNKKFESPRAMFESFMASNRSFSPKPKLSQPPPLSLHSEPFVIPSEQPTRGEQWNQIDFGYFDSNVDDKANGAGELVSVEKDVYYRNVVLFTQRIQNLVTFRSATLVKANVATSFWGSDVEWYTFELDDQERKGLHRDLCVDSWITKLSRRFKVPTSIAWGFPTSKSYSLNNARQRRPLAQYVQAISWHGIGYNIVDADNQLSFVYRGLAPELRLFISPPTNTTKVSNFIQALEEKQGTWYDMLISRPLTQRSPFPQSTGPLCLFYYSPQPCLGTPETFRPPARQFERSLPSQSKALSRYQSQRGVRPSPPRPNSANPTRLLYRRQNFQPQRPQY